MPDMTVIGIWYFLGISFIAVVVTCYDKWAATKRPKHRTRESTLLWLSAFGGSVAMYLTMLTIRHKTKHMKFMLGIPGIILAQIILLLGAAYIGGLIK